MTTSTATVVLEIVTADGIAAWDSPGAAGFDKLQATPPHVFDDRQPGRIPVHIRHGGPVVGHVDYLEEGLGYGGGGLYAVGVVDLPADLVDGCYCSPEIRADTISLRMGAGNQSGYIGSAFATSASLEACALVDATAGIAAAKVRAFPGDYRRQDGSFNWSGGAPTILQRAKKAAGWELRYRRPPSIVIRRAQEHTIHEHTIRYGVELRYGPPGAVLSVH
jgi:hypothetical protein